jgi:arylsulfatase
MKSLNYTRLPYITSIFLLFLAGCTIPDEKPERPNIIMIMADDLGYSDLGCYGSEIPTPNLDQLAQEALLFTQMYSCGRCWPSRSSFITGHYPRALNVDPNQRRELGVPGWIQLIPHYLSRQGYLSYHSGKWHVPCCEIENAGFEHYYFTRGFDRHFTPKQHWLDGDELPQPSLEDGYYSTVGITDYLVKFLEEHHQQHNNTPFFGYLAFISPHFPLHALQKDIDLFQNAYLTGWDTIRARRYRQQLSSGIVDCALSPRMPEVVPNWNLSEEDLHSMIGKGEAGKAVAWEELSGKQKSFQATKMAIHAAMVYRIDREVGKLIKTLQKLGIYDNTVIMFASDNGASAEQIIRGDMHDKDAMPGSAASYLCLGPGWSTSSNAPFKRHKYWMDEGGIASPFIISWPDGIEAKGQRRHTVCHFTDLLPTILELAGVQRTDTIRPELPGASIVPAFDSDLEIPHSPLYFDHSGNKAFRKGKWKIVLSVPEKNWRLYDMDADRSEIHNLAEEKPELLENLIYEWKTYRDYLDSLKVME